MEKIILKNWENGTKFVDYFDPLNEFDICNGIAYLYGDHIVSAKSAHARGFDIAPDFKLPGNVSNRIEVARFVEDVLGIKRQANPKLYFQTWSTLGATLPHGELVLGKNRNNNDK